MSLQTGPNVLECSGLVYLEIVVKEAHAVMEAETAKSSRLSHDKPNYNNTGLSDPNDMQGHTFRPQPLQDNTGMLNMTIPESVPKHKSKTPNKSANYTIGDVLGNELPKIDQAELNYLKMKKVQEQKLFTGIPDVAEDPSYNNSQNDLHRKGADHSDFDFFISKPQPTHMNHTNQQRISSNILNEDKEKTFDEIYKERIDSGKSEEAMARVIKESNKIDDKIQQMQDELSIIPTFFEPINKCKQSIADTIRERKQLSNFMLSMLNRIIMEERESSSPASSPSKPPRSAVSEELYEEISTMCQFYTQFSREVDRVMGSEHKDIDRHTLTEYMSSDLAKKSKQKSATKSKEAPKQQSKIKESLYSDDEEGGDRIRKINPENIDDESEKSEENDEDEGEEKEAEDEIEQEGEDDQDRSSEDKEDREEREEREVSPPSRPKTPPPMDLDGDDNYAGDHIRNRSKSRKKSPVPSNEVYGHSHADALRKRRERNEQRQRDHRNMHAVDSQREFEDYERRLGLADPLHSESNRLRPLSPAGQDTHPLQRILAREEEDNNRYRERLKQKHYKSSSKKSKGKDKEVNAQAGEDGEEGTLIQKIDVGRYYGDGSEEEGGGMRPREIRRRRGKGKDNREDDGEDGDGDEGGKESEDSEDGEEDQGEEHDAEGAEGDTAGKYDGLFEKLKSRQEDLPKQASKSSRRRKKRIKVKESSKEPALRQREQSKEKNNKSQIRYYRNPSKVKQPVAKLPEALTNLDSSKFENLIYKTKKRRMYIVVQDYRVKDKNYISLRQGDIVCAVHEIAGWSFVYFEENPRKYGFFPTDFLNLIN